MSVLQEFLLAQAVKHEAEPDWLRQTRLRAFDRLRNRGLPGAKDEEWRLTKLGALYQQTFETIGVEQHLNNIQDLTVSPSAGHRIVFVNGVFNEVLSDTGAPQGVSIQSLANMATEEIASLEQYFGQTLPDSPHGFICANTAFARDGYVIKIDDQAALKAPIEIVFVGDNQHAAAWHTRNLIVAGTNSEATIIERHTGTSSAVAYLSNAITEINLSNGARLDFYKLQDEAPDAYHISGLHTKQGRDSTLATNNIALGAKIARTDVISEMTGTGAQCTMNGLTVAGEQQQVDNCTEVIHSEPHCVSEEFYKSVLDDQARSVFRGRIVVAKDAQKTDANQQNKNLLLSPLAEADTKPQLEIYADDVKAAHGATVGQLEEKPMYYLKSRGIPEASAKALLTFAFANDVIRRFALPGLRQQLSAHLAGQLTGEDIDGAALLSEEA